MRQPYNARVPTQTEAENHREPSSGECRQAAAPGRQEGSLRTESGGARRDGRQAQDDRSSGERDGIGASAGRGSSSSRPQPRALAEVHLAAVLEQHHQSRLQTSRQSGKSKNIDSCAVDAFFVLISFIFLRR